MWFAAGSIHRNERLMTRYEALIGLELHVQLANRRKAFCTCAFDTSAPPNTCVCDVCAGRDGGRLRFNGELVPLALAVALALGCRIHDTSLFDRKHYACEDLPKGYQITQHFQPIATRGWFAMDPRVVPAGGVAIRQLHIEEDAAKVTTDGHRPLIDCNRAGVGLIEIVTEPTLRDGEQVAHCFREIRKLVLATGASHASMQAGGLRCDVNVSVRTAGDASLATRTEIKNLNSFRFAKRAVEYEIARQVALLEAGHRVEAQTLGWNDSEGCTYVTRAKTLDYACCREPQLPALVLDRSTIEQVRQRLPMLPWDKQQHYETLGLSRQSAELLTTHPSVTALFDGLLEAGISAKTASSFVCNDMIRDMEFDGLDVTMPLSVAQAAALLEYVETGKASMTLLRRAYERFTRSLWTFEHAREWLEGAALVDEAKLGDVIDAVLDEHAQQVAQYQRGKRGLEGYFVGQAVARVGGDVDAKHVAQLVRERLDARDGEARRAK